MNPRLKPLITLVCMVALGMPALYGLIWLLVRDMQGPSVLEIRPLARMYFEGTESDSHGGRRQIITLWWINPSTGQVEWKTVRGHRDKLKIYSDVLPGEEPWAVITYRNNIVHAAEIHIRRVEDVTSTTPGDLR